MGNEKLLPYYYSVNCNGFPVSKFRLLTREGFISITGIDPVTHLCVHE